MLQSMLPYALIYTFLLLAPGYLWLRMVRLPRAYSLCVAPIITTALVAIVGELYAAVHLPATPASVYLPLMCLPAALLLVPLVMRYRGTAVKGDDLLSFNLSHVDIPWWMPLLFIALGVYICNDLFVSIIPSADAVMQHYDNQHHLNTIQAMADAKRASSLGIHFYLADIDKAIMPFGRGTFYPAVWYAQCALLMQVTGITAPVAINVSIFVTLGIAYPLGMCALASSIFKERRGAIAFLAIVCPSFVTFPWCMLNFGPLYPNMVGFALLPATCTICMHAFLSGPSLRNLALAWVMVLGALLGQTLLHPNTVFSAYLILIPFVAQLIYDKMRSHGSSYLKSGAAVAGFLLVCLAFWTFCFKSPLFSSAIDELWGRYAYPWQEVINILTQTYTLFFFGEFAAQVLLGIFVVVGGVRLLYDREVRWLAASYLLICGICFVNATSYSATLKRFIAGFWYTDAMRLSAMAILVAALIAGYGFDWIYEQVCWILRRYNERMERKTHPQIAAVVLLATFYVVNFMPGFNWPGAHAESTDEIVEYRIRGREYDSMSVKTTFGDYKQGMRNAYNNHAPIDQHERIFLQEVADIAGDDLVINNPCDGSTIAYGIYGTRTYYRKATGNGASTETAESVAIREGLCNIAKDESVRAAIKSTGARYVLLLDSFYSGNSFLNLRNNLDWDAYLGISQITPETPGFTEVLSSGACSLYRIDEI